MIAWKWLLGMILGNSGISRMGSVLQCRLHDDWRFSPISNSAAKNALILSRVMGVHCSSCECLLAPLPFSSKSKWKRFPSLSDWWHRGWKADRTSWLLWYHRAHSLVRQPLVCTSTVNSSWLDLSVRIGVRIAVIGTDFLPSTTTCTEWCVTS